MPKTNKPKITVGITTCYGKRQLLSAVRSVKESVGVDNFEIIVIADSVPLTPFVKQGLKKMGVIIRENKIPSSAFAKQKQILKLCKGEIIVLTQDDMLFEKGALREIASALSVDDGVTFVGIRNEPVSPKTLVERGINVGTRLNNSIGKLRRDGDNYLAMLGRVMAFKVSWLKKLNVHSESVSLDAYLYLENKKHGGKYRCLWNTCLWFRNPTNIDEHIRKSSRFQNSKHEMLSYGKFANLEVEYKIPFWVILIAATKELMRDPIGFVIYVYIFVYTRVYKQKPAACLTALWEVDRSTKDIRMAGGAR